MLETHIIERGVCFNNLMLFLYVLILITNVEWVICIILYYKIRFRCANARLSCSLEHCEDMGVDM